MKRAGKERERFERGQPGEHAPAEGEDQHHAHRNASIVEVIGSYRVYLHVAAIEKMSVKIVRVFLVKSAQFVVYGCRSGRLWIKSVPLYPRCFIIGLG